MFNRQKQLSPKGKPGQRVYAIGDIHGCLSLLKKLLHQIKTDNDYRHTTETHLVFLGDLIDRGPNSQGVIEFLMKFPYDFARPLFIMGNHEEMLIRALSGEPHLLPGWLDHGGYACLESYGVDQRQLMRQRLDVLEHIVKTAIPNSHIQFLRGFLDYVQCGDFFFTHAGVRPGVSLKNQTAHEMRWIRDPFLGYEGNLGAVVVHGHTISKEIEVKHNRIGIDTGAYRTGRLSAVRVEEGDYSFLEVRGDFPYTKRDS